MPDLLALRPIVIDRRAPRRPIAIRKIGTEVAEVITLRAKVVIDDVKNDGQASSVAGIDQPFQPFRSSIGGLRGKKKYAVVAPITMSRKLGDRHELNGRNSPRALKVGQRGNDRVA